MKALFTFLAIGAACFIFAQAPQAFNYSAVVRDGSGNPIPNQLVKFRLSILRGSVTGPSVYVETHSTTTDANGMVNLEIGRGTVVSGVFAAIPWNNDAFFFQVEVDPAGGNTFILMGTTQFLSVPYALNAKYAETVAAQFVLVNNIDTVKLFRGKPYTASGTQLQVSKIKFYGGNMEDFTFNTTNIPSYINITNSSRSYTGNSLKNQNEPYLQHNITVSNSAPFGTNIIDNSVTTASNKVVNNNYVVEVLDDCDADKYLTNNKTKQNVLFLFDRCAISPFSLKYDTSNITILNTSNSDCNFKIRLDKYGIIIDCTPYQDSIIINSVTGTITGPIVYTNNTIQNITFTGTGWGHIEYTSERPSNLAIYLNSTITGTYTGISGGLCPVGPYTISAQHQFFISP